MDYAWRPKRLWGINHYTFTKWFKKEAISKAKQAKHREMSEDEEDEDESAPIAVAGSSELEAEKLEFDTDERTNCFRSVTSLTHEMMRILLSTDGRATKIRFVSNHPQYKTHQLALHKYEHIPILNGPRMKSIEMVLGNMDEESSEKDALNILAIYKPWHGYPRETYPRDT